MRIATHSSFFRVSGFISIARRILVAAIGLLVLPVDSPAQTTPLARKPLNEETRRGYREALQRARDAHDTSQEATTLLLLGLSDAGVSDVKSARVDLRRSAETFRSIDDNAGEWLAWVALAETEKNDTDYDAAVKAYRNATAALSRAAESNQKFSLKSLQSIGDLVGGAALPMPPGLMNEDALKPLMLLFAEVMTRDGFGSALLDSGDLHGAETEFSRAQERAGLFGGLFDTTLAAHRGDLRRRQWRFDDARKEYVAALENKPLFPGLPGNDDSVQLSLLSRLADVEMLSGRPEAALAWNDRARTIVAGDSGRTADVVRDRAALLFRAGRYDAAAAAYADALKLAGPEASAERKGGILADMAMLNMSRGKYGTAASELESAVDLFHKIGDADEEATAWALLSDVYEALGAHASRDLAAQHAKTLAATTESRSVRIVVDVTAAVQRHLQGRGSEAEVSRALAALWRSPEAADLLWRRDVATLEQSICDSSLLGGSAEAGLPVPEHIEPMVTAIGSMLEAREFFKKGQYAAARGALMRGVAMNPNNDFTPAFLVLIGASWAREGRLDRAISTFEDAAAVLDTTIEDIRIDDLLASYLGSGREIYYDVLIEALVKSGRMKEAFDVAERARARAFLQTIGNVRMNPKHGSDAALVAEAESARVQISDWLTTAAPPGQERERSADLRSAKEHYEALLTRLKISNPEYASMVTVQTIRAEDTRNELPNGATLISYYKTPWSLHAWVISRNAVHHVLLAQGGSSTDAAVCWAEHVARTRGAAPVYDQSSCGGPAAAEAAYQLLFKPLRQYVSGTDVFVVAHGSLHYVPFAALRDPASGRYLVQDFTISYLPSASSLSFIERRTSRASSRAVVFGDPAAADRGLPYAEEEAKAVAAVFGTTPFLGKSATESRLRELAHTAGLIHIAAHGLYDPEHPLFSRVELAQGEGQDGNLEVHEVLSDLDLSAVNLVVLGACDTAQGKRTGGDDIVGLTRAFLYAGTPGVVAALWKIDDEATAALMREFYGHLLSGSSAAESLRDAQRAMLRSGRFSQPEKWAAFGVYGDPHGRWSAKDYTKSPQRGQ